MACRTHRDANGTTYFVPEAKVAKDPARRLLSGVPELQVWWARRFKERRDQETLIIKQENNPKRSDVIELTLGQVYDLIHALGLSVMRP